jgi:hypothetical protein
LTRSLTRRSSRNIDDSSHQPAIASRQALWFLETLESG